MSNDKKLEALKKALELGASIDISFHSDVFIPKDTDQEEMEAKIKTVAEILGLEYQLQDGKDGLYWYKAYGTGIDVVAFYHDVKEDKKHVG